MISERFQKKIFSLIQQEELLVREPVNIFLTDTILNSVGGPLHIFGFEKDGYFFWNLTTTASENCLHQKGI